jgi:copper transport outer membrane protein MctB
MINLRYHIVSLAAVFLAFGLGILAGTTVIDQGLVSTLRSNTRALEKDLNDLRDNASGVQRQLDVWENFGRTISQPLLQGKLTGRAVVIVEDKRVEGALLSKLAEALRFAGAKRPTRLTLTEKWKLDSATDVESVRRTLGIAATEAGAVTTEAAARLGARLAGSSDPRARGDAIQGLRQGGFLDISDLPDGAAFPAANAVVIVLSSGDPEEIPATDDFLLPMIKAISATRIVAAAEPTSADQSIAELVRADSATARTVCTADHADTFAGRLSLIYGLRDLAGGRPAHHYGLRGGATAIAPTIAPAS